MSNLGTAGIKKLYDQWNVQGFVLLSLWLQTILILFAPLRKRTRNALVVLLSMLAYLVADWAVSVAVGLITYSQKEIRDHHDSQKFPNDDYVGILAFWAPFLLLHHLPEQDNAGLWQRQFIGLLNRVFNAFTVFSQSLPRNRLSVPTILLFVAGTLKYGERTYALFQANPKKLRESMVIKAPADPGMNYAKIMEAYSAAIKAKLPTRIELIPRPGKFLARYAADEWAALDELAAVRHAYHFFEIFKGLIVDLILSFREREESRQFFLKRTPEGAFKVIAIELNLMYEVFYTKAAVPHLAFVHLVVRFISWFAVVAALSFFYAIDKHNFRKIDVEITYSLFFGAIGLDTITFFKLAFSDWTAAAIQKSSTDNICIATIKRCFLSPLKYYLSLKRINWFNDTESTSCFERIRRILFRRWSESLYAYNLIDYCLKERPKRNRRPFYSGRILSEKMGLKDFYDRMNYVSKKPLTEKLWDFIFSQLRKKSCLVDDPDTAKRICSARGDWVLQDNDWNSGSSKLMSYVVDIDYDQSLIIWHVATELCYSTTAEVNNSGPNYREFCKILSDYMLYLLVMQPTMMSTVAGFGQTRFRDTCAEAKKFFIRKNLRQGRLEKEDKQEGEKREHKHACKMILEVNTAVRPVDLKGDRSKSVLFDGCILAKNLKELKGDKWQLKCEVWVELLSYAASHCRATDHVAQLSNGGELITFVWLLMAHFGIGDHVEFDEGHARAKVIVGK